MLYLDNVIVLNLSQIIDLDISRMFCWSELMVVKEKKKEDDDDEGKREAKKEAHHYYNRHLLWFCPVKKNT